MLAEHLGLLIPSNPDYGTEAWREMVLLNRAIGQHANCVMRLELINAKSGLACAKRGAAKDKKRSIPDERFWPAVSILDNSGRIGNMVTLKAEYKIFIIQAIAYL
ncbi:hypothetical protein [Klebsiella pneumoniae]|uniref:hypothetical protein n=1 Tax=Klebsiella pneumoniae TaxID=573 RepID=UPI00188956A1|nr:hypothetical protein [Klebsiella pneumoniae]